LLERALELDPGFAEARVNLGLTYIIAVEGGISNDPGDIFRAEEELRRVIREVPSIARAHALLGAVHFFQGRQDLAGETMLRAEGMAPQDMGGRMWRVILGRFMGNAEEDVIGLAHKMIEAEPLFWPPRYHLGELLREQGKTAEAVAQQEVVLEQDGTNVLALRCLARTHLDAGNLTQAKQTLARVRPQDRANFRVRMLWAQVYALEGKSALAVKELDEEVLKYGDLQPVAALDLAEVYALLGNQEKAIEWLDRSMRKGDGRVDWIRRDPLLKNVRAHPRFQQILASMEFRRQQSIPSPKQ
jgi:tetratricopeptide (TPR) repeat protein